MRYRSPTLGQFDDAMPDGGQPRASMPAPDGNMTFGALANVRGWRFGKAAYTEWFLYNPTVWNRLQTYRQWLSYSAGASDSYDPGRLHQPFFKAQFDAFMAANGDFEAFIDTVGRLPSNENLPTWYLGANRTPIWQIDQRPILPNPYPLVTGGQPPGRGAFDTAVRWGVFGLINKPAPNPVFESGGYFFLASIPLLTDVRYL